jgi:hypothetical protein
MEFDLMQESRSDHETTKKPTALGSKSSNGKNGAAEPRTTLVSEGTPEFDARLREAMEKVCQKYAWTAQQDGLSYAKIP